ncbi:MAG: DNA polymerase III alpha subunit, partial [Bacteroidia bacterium]
MYLNCHTYYSFKYGTMSPKELLCEADKSCRNTPDSGRNTPDSGRNTPDSGRNTPQRRVPTEIKFALTDINSTSGCLYHALECQSRGWPVIIGVDFRTGNRQGFIAIARNNEGFQNINYYLTGFLLQGKNTPAGVFPQDPVIKNAFIIYPLKNVPDRPLRSNE